MLLRARSCMCETAHMSSECLCARGALQLESAVWSVRFMTRHGRVGSESRNLVSDVPVSAVLLCVIDAPRHVETHIQSQGR